MARLTSRSRRRDRTRLVAAALAIALVGGLVAAVVGAVGGSGDGGGDDAADDGGAPFSSTTLDAGGIDVPAPDGWTAIPIANLGFGIAVPPGWEATVLAPEVLESLEGSSPQVPEFLDLAHAAAEAGAVFYAAGVDAAGRVADVMVRADTRAGVTDIAQLEDYARELADASGVGETPIEVVDGAEYPTVRMRYRFQAAGEPGVEGTETLVARPGGIVWSVIVTSEDPATHDALAEQITRTFAFPAG